MLIYNQKKESQTEKQEEDTSKKVKKNMAIIRSLDGSCNLQKTITIMINQKEKRTKTQWMGTP